MVVVRIEPPASRLRDRPKAASRALDGIVLGAFVGWHVGATRQPEVIAQALLMQPGVYAIFNCLAERNAFWRRLRRSDNGIAVHVAALLVRDKSGNVYAPSADLNPRKAGKIDLIVRKLAGALVSRVNARNEWLFELLLFCGSISCRSLGRSGDELIRAVHAVRTEAFRTFERGA